MQNKFIKEKPFGFLTKFSSDKLINFNPLPPVGQKLLKIFFGLSFFLTVITAIIITIFRLQLPDEVPLFFSRPWGQEQLAKRETLYLVPIISFLILSASYPVALLLLKKGDKFLSSVCALLSFLFSLLGSFAVMKIILLIK